MVKAGRLALISLGSNDISAWGDATSIVLKAMKLAAKLSEGDVFYSRLYTTPAFPAGSGPDFVNAAMTIRTSALPEDLLARLHGIENAAGRQRAVRWEQRTLDLDLIGLGDLVRPDAETVSCWKDLPLSAQMTQTPETLILPHPRIQDRSFALVPLAEIAPDWVHPLTGLSIQAMLEARPMDERSSVVPIE